MRQFVMQCLGSGRTPLIRLSGVLFEVSNAVRTQSTQAIVKEIAEIVEVPHLKRP